MLTAAAAIRLSDTTATPPGRIATLAPYALWAVQGGLALIFLFAGVMKFLTPIEDMQRDIAFPAWFLYFIGTAEICGALGLVLPGVAHIRRGLTPLAASGLVVIMLGATISTAVAVGVLPALFPFVVGLLALFVVRGRSNWFTKF